ncbi:MAG: hypothetical protein K8U57_33790 [Planctomycetes bacterium]|nr:hypothetical protein [Planctomycetota bacterium]
MATFAIRITLVVTGGILAATPAQPKQRNEIKPQVLSRFAIEEYEKLGGVYGHWVEGSDGIAFKRGDDSTGLGLPGFSFRSLPEAELRDIGLPFGIQVQSADNNALARMAKFENLVLFAGWSMTDEELKVLATFPNLMALDIDLSRATQTGVEQLGRLGRLRRLNPGRDVTDEQVKGLPALKKLTIIDLSNSKVKDLSGLGGVQSLTTLSVSHTHISRAGFKEISHLKNLATLNLSGVAHLGGYHFADLKELAPLATLKNLNLDSTGLDDDDIPAILTHKSVLNLSLKMSNAKTLKGLSALSQLTSLDLGYSNVTDMGMKEIGKCRNLRHLQINNTLVTETGLKELSGLSELQTLELAWTSVTEKGLRELAPLRKLSTLGLTAGDRGGYKTFAAQRARVTDETLRVLSEIGLLHSLHLAQGKDNQRPDSAENVVSFDLGLTEVTESGLKELAGLKNLSTLYLGPRVHNSGIRHLIVLENLAAIDLSRTEVTDEGLTELAHIRKLNALVLNSQQATDEGVLAVTKSRGLRYLDLSYGKLTDKGSRALVNLPSLTFLNLSYTKLTKTGLAELRSAMPDCTISR